MKKLHELKEDNFIAIAKLIDNNFIGNAKIIVNERKNGVVIVSGHTQGGQCCNCSIKVDVSNDKLNGVYTQNEDEDVPGVFRLVHPPILKRVIDYLVTNNFDLTYKNQST